MQGIDKKQLPVLIALSAIMLLSVGYSVTRSLKITKKTPVEIAQVETSATTRVAAQQPGAPTALDYGFIGNPPRDPFRPQLEGASSANPGSIVMNSQAAPPSGGTNGRRNGSAGGSFPLPPMGIPNLPGPLSVEGPGGIPTFGQNEPEKPAFTATGVVRGPTSVAILRGEDGNRYFAQEGQNVGEGYVVKSISPGGVVLSSNNRRIILKLGGDQDAKASGRLQEEGN